MRIRTLVAKCQKANQPKLSTAPRRHAPLTDDLGILGKPQPKATPSAESFFAEDYWSNFHISCEPDELGDSAQLEGIQKTIAEAAEHIEVVKNHAKTSAIFIVGFFCVPLVWYFLLDRLREVSAAVSGRDRNA